MTKQCPHCGGEINVGALLGSVSSRAKTKAARANAKLGGWPKGKKRGKRKKDANQIAHGVVAKAEKLTNKELWGLIKEAAKTIPRGIRQQEPPPHRLKVLPSPKAPKRGR